MIARSSPSEVGPAAAPGGSRDRPGDGAPTPEVRSRLRMLAYRRGKKIGAVADEVLDKALPR